MDNGIMAAQRAPTVRGNAVDLVSSHDNTELEIPFIPIVCAAPLMLAKARGIFERNGVRVRLRPAPGWSGIKELLTNGTADVAHMLFPMPFASHLGINGRQADLRICAVQNINGQAITLAKKHEGIRDPREMKGLVFGVPYPFSMQYYLLCDFFAKHGLDPTSDVSIIEVTPPRMPSYLEKGRLDGVLAPEPFSEIIIERGSGVLFALSRDIWPGHPCCTFAASARFAGARPDALSALIKSIVEAQRALHAADGPERRRIASELVALGYWRTSQVRAVENVLAGLVPDSRGGSRFVPDRVDFLPHVPEPVALWVLTQMQRWGQLPMEVDYREVIKEVVSQSAARAFAATEGLPDAPASTKWLAPVASEEAFEAMRRQPFCAFSARGRLPAAYDLPLVARSRLGEILRELAEVAGGRTELALKVTSNDEIGWLERMLNDVVRNLRFARESVDEALAFETTAHRQQAIIASQADLIRELSTPVLPVLDGVLVAPIVGDVDAERAERILRALLVAVSRERARVVLLDITGVSSADAAIVVRLIGMVRAISLLGAECILVGVPPRLAAAIAGEHGDLGGLQTSRNLRSGIREAQRLTGASRPRSPRKGRG